MVKPSLYHQYFSVALSLLRSCATADTTVIVTRYGDGGGVSEVKR